MYVQDLDEDFFFSKENPSLQPPGIEPATSQELPIKESRYLPLSHLDWFYRDDIIWSIYAYV